MTTRVPITVDGVALEVGLPAFLCAYHARMHGVTTWTDEISCGHCEACLPIENPRPIVFLAWRPEQLVQIRGAA
jgi:hypothetical protein